MVNMQVMMTSIACRQLTTDGVASQECSTPIQEGSNPMLNRLVLQTLFEYTSIKEIRTYRQVCKLWWEESLPRWRRGVRVKLYENGDTWERTLSMSNYLDRMNVSSDPFQFRKHPYQSFKLNHFKLISLNDDFEECDRQLEFWGRCGPKMTHLVISHSTFLSADDFEAILFRFVPKLVDLSLYSNNILLDEPLGFMDAPCESMNNGLETVLLSRSCGKFLPVDWLRFLGQFPSIKSLSINNFNAPPCTPGRELVDILNAMITLTWEHSISWKLEKLDLLFMGSPTKAVLKNQHSELFWQLHLPLTTLCLHVSTETTSTSLQIILETCSFTLQKLVVHRGGLAFPDEFGLEFPYGVQLDSLSELCLVGRLLCENLNFLQFTPNLTSLVLAQDIGTSLLAAGSRVSCYPTLNYISNRLTKEVDEMHRNERLRGTHLSIVEDTDFSRLEHVVCPNLKEFVLSGRQESACHADEVAALTKLMPNLTTLMLGLGNDGFRVACDVWKQLEVLIVQPYEVDQLGLTGNVPLIEHRLPNLTDLISLRYFGMGFETSGRYKTDLTKESVLNAIFPLKNLVRIAAVYNLHKMGVEVRDQLLSKFPKSKIHGSMDNVTEWQFAGDI